MRARRVGGADSTGEEGEEEEFGRQYRGWQQRRGRERGYTRLNAG